MSPVSPCGCDKCVDVFARPGRQGSKRLSAYAVRGLLSEMRMFSLLWVFTTTLVLSTAVLFVVSLAIQGFVFSGLLGGAFTGFALALALELAKLVTVIGKPLLVHATRRPGFTVRVLLALLRSGLILISVVCSVIFLALHIDKPFLIDVRADDLAQLQVREQYELDTLSARYKQSINDHQVSYEKQRVQRENTLLIRYQPQIKELEKLITVEMDNVVNGRFIGPRYQELQRRLEQRRRELAQALDQLHAELQREDTSREQRIHADFRQEKSIIESGYAQKTARVAADDYEDDERVSAPVVRSARNLIRGAFATSVTDHAIGLVLAILISSVGEIALLCLLAYLSKFAAGILTAEFDIWQHKLVQSMNTDVRIEKVRARNARFEHRVRRQRQRIESDARAYRPSSV